MDFLPPPFLFVRTGFVLPVPPIVLDLSGGGFRCRQTQVLLFPRGPSRSADFPPASRFRARGEMGRLRQSAFRRTPASGGLRRPLHAPGREFQSSDRGDRRRAGQVPMAGLPRQQSAENHASLGQGVHPPIPAPRSAQWIPPHSLLLVPVQSITQREITALPRTPGHASNQPKLFPTPAMRGLS